MSNHDEIQPEILPIADVPYVGLTTDDAQNPDTQYPPVEPRRPRIKRRHVLALLILMSCLAFLALGQLQQPAYSQGLTSPPELEGPTSTGPLDPAAEPVCDKNKPLPGQTARLIGDDEIMMVYRYTASPYYLRTKALNEVNGALQATWDKAYTSTVSYPELQTSEWLDAIDADLDGDRKAELAVGLRNSSNDIGAVSEAFLPDPSAANWDWSNNSDRTSGGTLRHVSVAAGNLDRSNDGTDEVVLAYADDYADFHVDALDGDSAGRIGTADNTQLADLWEDHHPGHERGDTWDYSVAAGDLNGDNFDDEFVTVFNDAGDDLQVIVMRYLTSTNSIKMIYQYDSHADTVMFDTVSPACDKWGNVRPIDVATGDLDGDQMDEIVTAFRFGDCNNDGTIELLYMDVISETNETDPTQRTLTIGNMISKEIDIANQTNEAATSVSIKAADLDGDGYDEVALGYNLQWAEYDAMTRSMWRRWQQKILTFEYYRKDSPDWVKSCSTMSTSCFVQKGSWASGSTTFEQDVDERGPQAKISLATGDTDQDGMDEIAFARLDPADGDAEVRIYNAESGNPSQIGSAYSVNLGSSNIYDFELAVGDMDGDSVWGTYNGTCYTGREADIQAVIHAPPFWPPGYGLEGYDNGYRTQASFAWSYSKGGGTGATTESTIGASTKLSVAKEGKTVGRSGSFTDEWERTSSASTEVMTTTAYGSGVETHSPLNVNKGLYESPNYEAMSIVEAGYFCYNYTTPADTGLGTIPVCVVQPLVTYLKNPTIEAWYEEGPTKYPDSWVPLGSNLAEGRNANESSSYSGSSPDTDAQKAVDGNIDGDNSNGSVAYTGYDQYAWWQVDLGGLQWIDAIQLYNRTDAGADRLKNWYVFVTDENHFASNDPNVLKTDPNVWHWPEDGIANPAQAGYPSTVPINHYGRLVRIQLAGTNNLNMAEVQVYGMPGTPDQWPEGRPQGTLATTDPFTLTWRDGRKQAIPGKLYLVWPDSANLGIEGGTNDMPFATGTGADQQTVTESGYSEKYAIGMETKIKKGTMSYEKEHSWGTSSSQSVVTTWGKDVEFEGLINGFESTEVPDAMDYAVKPYVWQQEAKPDGGGVQKYLVLDYWVPVAEAVTPTLAINPPAAEKAPVLGPLVVPQAPVITSPTHPNPSDWYDSSTATFNWIQPAGDPATITHYHWILDQNPDTVPAGYHLGPITSATYTGLDDGVYYLHVSAMSSDEEWSATSHFKIQVDTRPPEASLALDPPWPNSTGWYITPVTVTASADESIGSGVAGIEVSTDSVTWQPYSPPWVFNADTPGTTVYARATDGLGHVSDPVSKTFKIDRTPPNSHVSGGDGPGALVATVRTDPQGNQELVLAGAIADNLSGRSTMVLEQDGLYWNKTAEIGVWHPLPDPAIEVNWYYTSTNDLGAGYHIFTGHAVDTAGNQEEPYELARVLWLPQTDPDLGGSSLSASQKAMKPGQQIEFTLVARNAGYQEAHVAVSDVLPKGLTPVTELLPAGVTYDPATHTLTWPSRLVWPGQWYRRSFVAQADADLGATELVNQATFHAFWPNTDSPDLTAEEKKAFTDREQTVTKTFTVKVDPKLSDSADVTPPWGILMSSARQMATGPDVPLSILATDDARWMYLREWTPDPLTGDWVVARSSDWIDYSPEITWTLSPGQGVKYIGVWLQDAAGNVSTLSEASLIFTNRMDDSQTLANGQRVQYRGLLEGGEVIYATLKTVSGDPDAYLWKPRNAFWPDRAALDTVSPGEVEEYGETFAPEPGRYLFEVGAVGDSEYELTLTGGVPMQPPAVLAALFPQVKQTPPHPLTVSDPLSAGQIGTVVSPIFKFYLPVIVVRY